MLEINFCFKVWSTARMPWRHIFIKLLKSYSVGVEFNKYIARQWSGRADVIVPSHNLAMIYEDEEGNTYMANAVANAPVEE